MNKARMIGCVLCSVALAMLVCLAAGCRVEPKQQAQAKDTKDTKETKNPGDTAKDSSKQEDPDEAYIRGERAKLSLEDRKLVDAQEWCVTSGERLGSMEGMMKLMVKDRDGKGQPVFICCGGCKRDALKDEAKTLAKVEELRAKKRTEADKK